MNSGDEEEEEEEEQEMRDDPLTSAGPEEREKAVAITKLLE